MKKYLYLCLLFCLILGCEESFETDDTSSEILDEMLDIAQEHALFRADINWENTTNSVRSEFDRSGFQPAVRVLLRILADSHSSYRFENWTYRESFVTCRPSQLSLTDLPDQVGYVTLGPLDSQSLTEDVQAYTDRIQEILQGGREQGVTAWVVDLTGNTGGQFAPMLAGIGPLLGNDIHGYFMDPDDGPIAWGYDNGDAYISERDQVFASATAPIEVFELDMKVAIIIDNQTASAGEATAISFIGRPNTRIFGERSCGLSTGNTSFDLSNGAIFNLTTAIMADRNQTPFGEHLTPDESFLNAEDLQTRVEEWLLEE